MLDSLYSCKYSGALLGDIGYLERLVLPGLAVRISEVGQSLAQAGASYPATPARVLPVLPVQTPQT